MEIWVVDVVAIVILTFLRGNLTRPPFIVPMALYFIASLIATFEAQVPEAAGFYCWQLMRVFLLYFTVANVCACEVDAISAILTGLAAGELLECAKATWQRFGQHILQSPGTLGSQNELGIASHFVVLPFFAILLGGRRGWLPTVVVLAGLMTYVLTTSRASVLLGLTGLCLVWLLSSFAQFSGRKLSVVIFGFIALALMAPIAMSSFDKRFAHSSLGLAEDTERLTFKRAAWMIIQDHPEGVGPNNFALVANVGGYYNRSGAVSTLGNSSNVHNIYILVWAEAGAIGLASFLLMLASPLIMGLRFGMLSRRGRVGDPKKDILIGASITLLIVYIHSTEEWVPIVAELQYLLAIMFGLIAGITAEERASKKAQDFVLATS